MKTQAEVEVEARALAKDGQEFNAACSVARILMGLWTHCVGFSLPKGCCGKICVNFACIRLSFSLTLLYSYLYLKYMCLLSGAVGINRLEGFSSEFTLCLICL